MSVSSCQSQLVLSWCVKTFVKLHNEGGSSVSRSESFSMSWNKGGIDAVLQWILSDVDDALIQQVCFIHGPFTRNMRICGSKSVDICAKISGYLE